LQKLKTNKGTFLGRQIDYGISRLAIKGDRREQKWAFGS
jgi:hypothetical protein